MKPVHFDIRIQGTPGKAMMAVITDLSMRIETQVRDRHLKGLLSLCEFAIKKRIAVAKEMERVHS